LKIMCPNPSGLPGHHGPFADLARDFKRREAEVHVTSLPVGDVAFTHIEGRARHGAVTPGILRATRAAAAEGLDALATVWLCDTGLKDARAISGARVVSAPCQSAGERASRLANRLVHRKTVRCLTKAGRRDRPSRGDCPPCADRVELDLFDTNTAFGNRVVVGPT